MGDKVWAVIQRCPLVEGLFCTQTVHLGPDLYIAVGKVAARGVPLYIIWLLFKISPTLCTVSVVYACAGDHVPDDERAGMYESVSCDHHMIQIFPSSLLKRWPRLEMDEHLLS